MKGVSAAYACVAAESEYGSPGQGGLFTVAASQTSPLQVAYTWPNWNLTAACTRDGAIGSWSLAGYWQPSAAGWIPRISAGWGHDQFAFASYPVAGLSGVHTTSWYLGLNWSNVFGPGNSLSMAVGAPAHITHLEGLGDSSIKDAGLAFELATRIHLSDTFSLTPAVFWLSRPRGAMAGTSDLSEALLSPQADDSTSLGVWAVRATLRF